MAKGKMYYDRVMNKSVIKLLGNEYHWLIDFVKQRDDLDFQTGSNYFSIYRGTTRILKISSSGHLSAHQKYIDLEPDLYKKPTKELFDSLIFKINLYK